MNCVGCGFVIQAEFTFCPKCGARQPARCAGCGYACPPDFAFCPKCGQKQGATPQRIEAPAVAPPSPAVYPEPLRPTPAAPAPTTPALAGEADRRTVTILFADLSGFTTLSERLDPEVMQALQNELFEELTAAVQEFGGFVDKFVGDALLALFGAPHAHEDDPERALSAALAMLERTARLDARWRGRAGLPLTLHLGVNTGPVVAGGFGAGSAKSYSVTGDTVNTAQRLQSLAGTGEVLVGPTTCRLARHAFGFESMGEVALKGKSGQHLVHRLIGPLEAPREARGLEALGLSAPLIGRGAELSRMFDCLERAVAGDAHVVRLIGDAGIGKSRLVRELLAQIEDDERFGSVVVRRTACSPLGEQHFGALGAILRSAYDIAPKDSATATREKLAAGIAELGLSPSEGAELMPSLDHVLGLGAIEAGQNQVEPEQLKRQIHFAVRTLFERRLARAPVLLVVEDLHWADAASIEVIRLLADRLDRSRLMIVLTHRPAFEAGPLATSRTNHVAIRLPPLQAPSSHALLDALFGGSPLPQELRGRIVERADGNPLFLEEIVRGLIENGTLAREGSSWHVLAKDGAAEIPLNIQGILLARLDRLPREARTLVQEAAVVGPRFDAALLRTIASDPARVRSQLDLLLDAELIDEEPGSGLEAQFRFTQSLLQDVIYQNLLVQRRMELHGRIGRALEARMPAGVERLEDLIALGHHFCLSEEKAKGARFLGVAGDRASAAYANDDAIRHYQQALAALLAANEQAPERLVLCERIADLCRPIGRRETAQEHYNVALRAYQAAGDHAAAARIMRKVGGLLWDAGRRDQAEAGYAEALVLLEGTDAPIERAHLSQERGRLAFRMGDHAGAVKWADEAIGYAETYSTDSGQGIGLEAARAVAEALNTKGVALARLGRNVEAVREIERSVAAAEAAGLQSVVCRAYTNLGVLYTVVDPARAIAVCRRGLEVATRIGDLGFQARLYTNLAVACCMFTDRCGEEGVPAAEKAIEIDRALDQREHLAVPLTVLAQIHQCHDAPDLALRYYHEALEVARETGEPQLLFPCYDGLATLCLDRDDMEEAERYFGLAKELCDRHGLDPGALIVLPFLD
jgi:predicted ATPase/class 3 adenylate cyclase